MQYREKAYAENFFRKGIRFEAFWSINKITTKILCMNGPYYATDITY